MSLRDIYAHPALWSIWDASRLSAGVYSDGGPRGHGWTNSVAPTAKSNWLGVTGLSAARFDGSTNYITGAHNAPMGPFTIVALASIDPAHSTGDNVNHFVAGGITGTGSSQVWGASVINAKVQALSQGAATAQSAAIAVGAARVFMFAFRPATSQMTAQCNGATAVSTALTNGQVPMRKDYSIGARLGNGATRAGYLFGDLAQVQVFACDLFDTRFASLQTDVYATLLAAVDSASGLMSVNTQPSTTATSGANIGTQPRFNVLTTAGATDTGFTGNVTISADGPGTLGGTLTVAAVAGVATFAGISITGAGTTRISARASGRGAVQTRNIVVS